MAYSQKYSLVHFIHPVDVGLEFQMADWPLHVAFTDVFAIDLVGTQIEAKLEELLSKCPTVVTHATEDATLSMTSVVLLENNESLLTLHTQIIELLVANGAVLS